jgi:hypothetical protein
LTRDLNSTLKAALQEENVKPTVLLSIATGTSPATIYITNNEVDLAFPTGGQTYTARPFAVPEIMISGGEAHGGTIDFADADLYWGTWLQSTDFRFQKVEMRLVERDNLGASTYTRLDTMRVRGIQEVPYSVGMTIEPLSGIFGAAKLPKRTLSREDFPGLPQAEVY